MHFKIRSVSTADEHLTRFLGASDDFTCRFNGIVIACLKDQNIHPRPNCSNSLILVYPAPNTAPIAFHYFYTFENPQNNICCELWAVYVEDEHRRRGIAFELMHYALRLAHAKGVRIFIFRFTAPQALDGKLVRNLRALASSAFPDSFFCRPGLNTLIPL